MLSNEKVIKEADNAINWIKEYVESARAKGVVVRCKWRKRFGNCYGNGCKSFRKG